MIDKEASAVDEIVTLSVDQYRSIASFRHRLRRFLAFSETAAAAVGLPAQQHQALLAIAGHDRAEPPTIGNLAEQLVIAPHSAAELVSRMVAAGLVSKSVARSDRRKQELALTPKSASLLASLTETHLGELKDLHRLLSDAVSAAR